jgi:hypothetical protein
VVDDTELTNNYISLIKSELAIQKLQSYVNELLVDKILDYETSDSGAFVVPITKLFNNFIYIACKVLPQYIACDPSLDQDDNDINFKRKISEIGEETYNLWLENDTLERNVSINGKMTDFVTFICSNQPDYIPQGFL